MSTFQIVIVRIAVGEAVGGDKVQDIFCGEALRTRGCASREEFVFVADCLAVSVEVQGKCSGLGFLTAMTPSGSLMMFAAIGVCGSFTTFSTYSVHSVALLQEGRYGAAVVYIIGTVILCLILAWAGLIVGQRINSHI